MIEEWRPIPGFEGYYSVSDLGCVRSERRVVKHARMGTNTIRERILKASPNNKGYRRVSLQRKGVILERGVHQVVALAFIGGDVTFAKPRGYL